jgi:hypothetical protein
MNTICGARYDVKKRYDDDHLTFRDYEKMMKIREH